MGKNKPINSISGLENQVKCLTKEIGGLDTNTQEFIDKSKELNRLKNQLLDIDVIVDIIYKNHLKRKKNG